MEWPGPSVHILAWVRTCQGEVAKRTECTEHSYISPETDKGPYAHGHQESPRFSPLRLVGVMLPWMEPPAPISPLWDVAMHPRAASRAQTLSAPCPPPLPCAGPGLACPRALSWELAHKQTSPLGLRQWQRLTQLMLAGPGRELDDQQLLAVEAPANAVGLGNVGAAGRRPPKHAHHLCVGVVCELDEGRWDA